MRVLAYAALAGAVVPLVTFDGAKGTSFKFSEMNDPVMGGMSTGNFSVTGMNTGLWTGEVVDVPKLQAPGFLKIQSGVGYVFHDHFNDATGMTHLLITGRSLVPYLGFKVSLGHNYFPVLDDYKADFNLTSEWSTVAVPFNTFSDKWSSYTGEPTKTCAEDSSVCVGPRTLKNIGQISFWAEGVKGKVHMEIKSISAGTAADAGPVAALAKATTTPAPSTEQSVCIGKVAAKLRFNVSGYPPEVPVSVDDGEELAEAICCDARTRPYAEPQFFFQRPEINLFGNLEEGGVTTFYDPVCGVPLFRAPMNRTLAAWKAETTQHGWPSFRTAEAIDGAVVIRPGGAVYSTCGTYLGSNEPDASGTRYCLDLVCLSGMPPSTKTILV